MKTAARESLPTHVLLGTITAGLLILAAVRLELYQTLMQEDGWGEWATFLAFGIAGVIGTKGALQKDRAALERLMLAGLAAFGFFVAGEEISWGQRMLGFQPPEIFLEKNYQQESNLHNLLKDILDTRWIVLAIALLYGVIAPIVARFAPKLRVFAPRPDLAPYFLVVVVLEAMYPWDLAGEMAEMLLGLALLSDVSRRAITSERTTLIFEAAALAGAMILVPLVDAVSGIDAEQGRAQAQVELEQLQQDLERPRGVRSKAFKKQRVHKRIFTAVRAEYLRFGDQSAFLGEARTPGEGASPIARHDARGYFLDPWNQPYWILSYRLSGDRVRVLLYSFGPNRRRDSKVDAIKNEGPVLEGDDVGVLFEVGREKKAALTAQQSPTP